MNSLNGHGRAGDSFHSDGEEEDEDTQMEFTANSCLPVASLPADFDGEAEDGATYLALAIRSNAALPFFANVPNPYRQRTITPELADPARLTTGHGDKAGPSRHPALPRSSWQELFPKHLVAYRKENGERWPPSPRLPYPPGQPPLPPSNMRSEWRFFIFGYPRQRVKAPPDPQAEAAMELDEEEAIACGPAPVVDRYYLGQKVGRDGKVVELEGPRHRPREPLVSFLQALSPHHLCQVIGHITAFVKSAMAEIEEELLSTQPARSPSSSSDSDSEDLSTDDPTPNPFPARLARWAFAILLILDRDLTGDQISPLRELAKVLMRVAGWRFITAVTRGEVTAAAPVQADDGLAGPTGWEMGRRWKEARDKASDQRMRGLEAPDPAFDLDETGVDETLARCWLIVHTVAGGWGQLDLLSDLEELYTS